MCSKANVRNCNCRQHPWNSLQRQLLASGLFLFVSQHHTVKKRLSKLRSTMCWRRLSKLRTSGHPAPEQVQKQQELASPVTRILSLSAPGLRLLTSCMMRLMTLRLKPPASQLFMKPTCTIGRVQQKVWPLAGGWVTLQACDNPHKSQLCTHHLPCGPCMRSVCSKLVSVGSGILPTRHVAWHQLCAESAQRLLMMTEASD